MMILVALLDESHVRLDQPGLGLVVAQAGTGIESANEVHRRHHRFQRTAHGLGDFLVVLVLQARADARSPARSRRPALPVRPRDGRCRSCVATRFRFCSCASRHSRRSRAPTPIGIHLLDQIDGFPQCVAAERHAGGQVRGGTSVGRGARGSGAAACVGHVHACASSATATAALSLGISARSPLAPTVDGSRVADGRIFDDLLPA